MCLDEESTYLIGSNVQGGMVKDHTFTDFFPRNPSLTREVCSQKMILSRSSNHVSAESDGDI